MGTDPANTDEGYFNDLSRQPMTSQTVADSNSPTEQSNQSPNCDGDEIPKTKRIACVICRKRKLKCDGNRPKCATCARLGHNCAYDEARRKSGPKRGYVKELEARLAQVEAQFKDRDPKKSGATSGKKSEAAPAQNDFPQPIPEVDESMDLMPDTTYSMGEGTFKPIAANDPFTLPVNGIGSNLSPDLLNMPNIGLGMDDNYSWEMIGLGLEEPMPMQEAIDELTGAYFDKVHPSMPFLHKYRYQASMNLSPASRPPICLRYIMWAHAASITEKYMHHQEIFYRRARKYAELDEMKGSGEVFVSVAHAQTWILVAAYEFKMMYFPRAWMSVGRGARMVLMMGLNRVDGLGLDVKQCLPPPRDWTEREERRRTFWMAYCVDRYASIGTGWPMAIDERDIKSHLPASEENYENSTPQKTFPMSHAMTQEQVSQMSSFAGVVYVTHFFGLNLTHLHRPENNDNEHDLQGQFWKRHRQMDNILLNTSLSLPSHLRLPAGVRNANIVFLNFAIHTSTVCLHQAAIFKAEKNQLPQSVVDQSRSRCILAASEIASVMRLTSHLDVAGMNPFMAFCLYVASRVFVQFLKKTPGDQEIRASLEFLLTAMAALRKKNPLTESFMVQLNLDIEGSGLDIMLHNPDYTSIAVQRNREFSTQFRRDHDPNCPIPVYGSPMTNLDGSSEDQRRDSTRTHDWQSSGSASVRTESPRQTPYALGNIQLQAMSNQEPALPTFNPEMKAIIPQGLPGVFPQGSWNDTFNGEEAPIGMNPLINNDINLNLFDTDMSDATNHSNSNGLTPASSNTNPSVANSTYSPPQVEDDTSGVEPNQPRTHSPFSTYAPTKLPTFTGARPVNSEKSKSPDNMPSNLDQNDAFKMAPGWDFNGPSTPGFTGMTPGGNWGKMVGEDGSWDKLMQERTWWDENQRMTMSPK